MILASKGFNSLTLGRVFRALVIAGGLSAPLASAAEVDRALLMPAIEAIIVAGMADARNLMACAALDAGAEAAESVRESWAEERGTIVATLWATGFSDGHVRTIEEKSDPGTLTAATLTPERCREIVRRHPLPEGELPHRRVWRTIVTAGINFGAIKPIKPRTLAIVQTAFDENLPRQAIVLRCLSFEDATLFERAATSWRTEIAGIRNLLREAGWPRDVIERLTRPADIGRLTRRAELAATDKAACRADRDWERWLTDLGPAKLGVAVRGVLAED